MNLYKYLTEYRGRDSSHAAGEAKRAYARFPSKTEMPLCILNLVLKEHGIRLKEE